ncbi:MAG: class I SAM-dependent methyltransferase [Gammaproteobacteria bacterium]|nr:class I SAM-dependent methyltransferase [Gammaproteobacteria bacterium]
MKKSVVFFYVDFADPMYRLMVEMMAASVHMVLPDHDVVMLTDDGAIGLTGVDYIVKANTRFDKNNLMPARMRMIDAYIQSKKEEEIIFTDADILFFTGINFFQSEFDVALTWRGDFPSMPFNTGVMATRTTKEALNFWRLASEACQTLPAQVHGWYGDQISVAMTVGLNDFYSRTGDTILSGNAVVKLFPCEKYNYSPNIYGVYDADILHFKGERKKLMVKFFSSLCHKYLGIKGGFFQPNSKSIELLLLQRTDYKNIEGEGNDSKETLISAKLTIDLYNEYRRVSPYLPVESHRILDIGCGLGGINYFFYNHYNAQSPDMYLLDKDEVSESIYFGFEETAAAYNNLLSSRQLLEDAGVPGEKIHVIDINKDKFPKQVKYDLIFSSLSWGFHYPISTYISEVVESLSNDGVLIIDVRKNTDGLKLIKTNFSNVKIIIDSEKYQKICASNSI